MSDLTAFQQRIGHCFQNVGLLLRALTHRSYVNEHPEEEDNQRLEFLGDAVLNFVVAAWIFEHYPNLHEGEMTRLRAALVREESLARFAVELGLGEVLRLGHGEEESGGRERSANLEDGFEALMGALYLDGGLGPAQRLLHRLIEGLAEDILSTEADKDEKSRLQEWSQAELGVTPRYRIVAELGPGHDKTFVAEVLLGKQVAGRGEGRSKQAAERAAARAALESIDDEQEAIGDERSAISDER